jgi:hypothetical protein
MQGIAQTQARSRVWLAGVARRRLRCFVLIVGALLPAAAFAPAAAHAVIFSGPTPFVVENAPQAMAVADFNGDSDPDMAVVNEFSHSVSILLGGSGGSFTTSTSIAVGQRPLWAATGEFNGDSDPDLAVVNEGTDDVSILLGGSGASFSGPTNFAVAPACTIPPCSSIRPQAVVVGKFDTDSDPDLAVVNEGTNDVSILLGGSGGSFGTPASFPVGSTPRSIAVGKFNTDSDPDLAVANEGTNDISVLLGDAGGTFTGPTNFGVGSAPTSIATGEFNGDSDPDLAVADELSHDISVLLGGSGGSFGAATSFAAGDLPDTVAVGELNRNSDPELVVANQGSGNISLLFGSAAGSFVGPVNIDGGQRPTAIAIADFNGDSDADIAVANELSYTSPGTISILLSVPPETTIDSGPPALTNDSTPTFTFFSNDPNATFQCRVDGGSFAACSSPHTRSALSDGSHTFEVRANDDAGRPDPTPALRSFVVDTVAPSAPTLIATVPASSANDNNPRVRGTAAANSTVRLYTTNDCSGSAAATGSAADFAVSGLQTSVADNSTTRFRATAADEAGNVSGCSTTSVTYVEVSPPPTTPPPDEGGEPSPEPPAPGAGTPISAPISLPLGGADTIGPGMTVTGRAVKNDARGAVPLALSCPSSEPGGCAGILVLETLDKVWTKGGGRTRRKRRVKLGQSSFRIAGGKTALVKVRLGVSSQRLLRKLRKLRVVATIEARDQTGNARTTKVTLVVRAAPVKEARNRR